MLEWVYSGGGANGAHWVLKLDGKWVGHFYEDADLSINVKEVREKITRLWNESEGTRASAKEGESR